MGRQAGLPTLVVVSGPGGSGKTTLAHALAGAVGCPAVCRDEIKEGMVHGNPGFRPQPGDALTQRTVTTFFRVIEVLLTAGVTVVAEAAFQDRLWRFGLDSLIDHAHVRVIRCEVSAEVARERMRQRLDHKPRRSAAHADVQALAQTQVSTAFEHISLPTPNAGGRHDDRLPTCPRRDRGLCRGEQMTAYRNPVATLPISTRA